MGAGENVQQPTRQPQANPNIYYEDARPPMFQQGRPQFEGYGFADRQAHQNRQRQPNMPWFSQDDYSYANRQGSARPDRPAFSDPEQEDPFIFLQELDLYMTTLPPEQRLIQAIRCFGIPAKYWAVGLFINKLFIYLYFFLLITFPSFEINPIFFIILPQFDSQILFQNKPANFLRFY
jgi:hypothetical protein